MSSEVQLRRDVLPNIGVALKALDRLENDIRTAGTFEALDAAANAAAGLQRTFQPVKNVADRAGEVWIAAETKLAEELDKLPKAVGTRSNFRGRDSSGGTKLEPPESDVASLKSLGVAKKRAARARRIKQIPKEKRAQYIDELKADDKAVTPDALLRKQREENKNHKKHSIAAARFSAEGPFDCVVIDPPWDMAKIDREVRPNQDAFDYPTMSEDQIAEFWAADVASRLSTDCHVFMWTTQKFLPVALNLLGRFGLRYVFTMVWHKSGGFQPHDLPQYNCEFVVYGRQGSPLFVDTKDFACCFQAPRREHSRKPDLFYDTVRRVTGGSRIDIFSRELRPGFAQFGNEMDKFSEAAA